MQSISNLPSATSVRSSTGRRVQVFSLATLTLLLAGRAMTLAFVGDAGGPNPADPPLAWLLPLLGDAVIGVTAPLVAVLVMRGSTLFAWTLIVGWNIVGVWDALSAYVVHTTTPWSNFFMIEIFGPSMFFMAAAVHVICLWLMAGRGVRAGFGLVTARRPVPGTLVG